MSTIFTKIIEGEIPGYIVAKNEEFCAFFDAFPVQYGHTLIVPIKEVDYIFDLSPEELARMMAFAQQVANAIKEATKCRKVGLAVIGLEVPHVHIHLVPMHKEKDMDFNVKIDNPDKAIMEDLLKRIKSFL